MSGNMDLEENGIATTSLDGSMDPIIKSNGTGSLSSYGTPQKKQGKSWVITPVTIFIIVLGALLFAAIIGLIVGLAHPDRGKTCQEFITDPPTQPTEEPTDPPTTEPPVVNIRLPTSVIPSHYTVTLRPDIYDKEPEEFFHTGRVVIDVECAETTNVITLHFRTLEIDRDTITVTDVASGENLVITGFSEETELVEFFHIQLQNNLEVGNQYQITIGSFEGPIRDDLQGLYYSSYVINDETRYLVASQCQPVDARKIFPLFDEPNFKATFDITMERLAAATDYRCQSNMRVESETPVGSDWIADKFYTTPIMSPYLLAFVVSDFNCVTSNSTGKDVDVCARPNAMDQTEFAASIASPMQGWFEEYHEIDYPLDKNTHIAVPDFGGGAMENWGLIIYRETSLLFEEGSSTADQRQRVAVVVSHELAHMWFGNLVTMLWWDDVWLNEGFASYMEVLGVDSQFPEWNMEADFVIAALQDVMTLDALANSHPVFVDVTDPAGIFSLFDTITYSKGSSVVRMMRYYLSEATFKKGLTNYLNERAYESAGHEDVFNAMREQYEEDNNGETIDVYGIMDTWIKQLGYPVVMFNFDRTNGKLTLTQEHFLLDPTTRDQLPESPYNYKWTIPINFATNKDPVSDWESRPIEWMDKDDNSKEFDIDADSEWVIGNLNEVFYYRVNYDDDTWTALINQMKTDHEVFGLSSRSQLVDDAFNLGRANIIPQTVALEISSYLGNEEELFPWRSFSNNIAYMADMLVTTGSYGSLMSFIQNTVEPVYNDTIWNDQVYAAEDEHVEKLKRTLTLNLACNFGNEDCMETAYQQFKAWMDSDTAVDVDLRPVVYCNGIAAGGEAEWEFAFKKLEDSNSGSESSNLLQALGCTQEDWLLRRYMEEGLFGDVVKLQDFSTVIASVAANSKGRNIAWSMFVENWDLLFERYGTQGFLFANIVNAVTSRMSTQYEYNLVESFMEANPEQGNAAAAFIQALGQIKVNIAWKENNQDEVIEWLRANV